MTFFGLTFRGSRQICIITSQLLSQIVTTDLINRTGCPFFKREQTAAHTLVKSFKKWVPDTCYRE